MTSENPASALFAGGPFGRPDGPYALLEADGPDAAGFLHRLTTQDVLGLPPGQVAPTAFLDAKGKVQATCLLFRLGDSVWLEMAAEQRDRIAALLERYHFSERLAVRRVALGPCGEVIGAARPTDERRACRGTGGAVELWFQRRGVAFHRVHGGAAAGAAAPLDDDRAQCLGMLAGLVRIGSDTEPSTLALEADLDDHCAPDKGCYTGQEVVARIQTYGHVNRRLCLLALPSGLAIGAPLLLHEPVGLQPVGRVMRAVPMPTPTGGRLGLGYLPGDFQALGSRLTLADGTPVEVVGFQPLPP